VAPSGVIGYNCNYNNFPELPDGEVFDMQTYVKDSLGRYTFSGLKWQVCAAGRSFQHSTKAMPLILSPQCP
jgi:hypothetical protein